MVSDSRLSKDIQEKVRFLAQHLPDETEWLVVKKMLLTTLSPSDRSNFSTRDPKSKKHFPFNEFENDIRSLWRLLTDRTLVIPIEKRVDEGNVEGYL